MSQKLYCNAIKCCIKFNQSLQRTEVILPDGRMFYRYPIDGMGVWYSQNGSIFGYWGEDPQETSIEGLARLLNRELCPSLPISTHYDGEWGTISIDEKVPSFLTKKEQLLYEHLLRSPRHFREWSVLENKIDALKQSVYKRYSKFSTSNHWD